MWGEIEVAADLKPRRRRIRHAAEYPDHGERLRELLQRRQVNRSRGDRADLVEKYPPLSEDEHAELKHLNNWSNELRDRWDNLDPMTPEEVDAHRSMNGSWIGGARRLREPETMNTRDKAEYYSGLHDRLDSTVLSLTPREQHDHDVMGDWAEQHFGSMQADAADEMGRYSNFRQTGRHIDGARTLERDPDGYRPELTGDWASEVLASKSRSKASEVLKTRAGAYHDARQRMATEGPHGRNEKGLFNHQALAQARNNLRVELQQQDKFKVPSVNDLSRIEESSMGDDSKLINPRYNAGMPGSNAPHRDAYKINCQRCVLAAEARGRGYNVEAQRNYQTSNPDSPNNDIDFSDPMIANWFRDKDGNVPRWQDAQDEFRHPRKTDGPWHWDAMTDHIKNNWGPGARGMVAFSYPNGGRSSRRDNDNVNRHVISASVDNDGNVHYDDPQSGEENVGAYWQNKIDYEAHGTHVNERAIAQADPQNSNSTFKNNRYYSPLRFMRTDDKDLNPEVSQYMIDRGSAGGNPIRAVTKSKPLFSALAPKN